MRNVQAEIAYHRYRGLDIHSCEALRGGLTNRSFLVNGNEVIRLKTPGKPFGYSPSGEKSIWEEASAARLSPDLLAFDETTGDMVTRYEASFHPFLNRNVSKEELQAAASAIKAFHTLPATGHTFDPIALFDHYQTIKPQGIELHFYEMMKEEFYKGKKVLCHNDLVRGNVLRSEQGEIRLLDFEFAGLNLPSFDVASLCGENEILDEGRIRFLTRIILDGDGENNLRSVYSSLYFQSFLWLRWAQRAGHLASVEEKKAIISSKRKALGHLQNIRASHPRYFGD